MNKETIKKYLPEIILGCSTLIIIGILIVAVISEMSNPVIPFHSIGTRSRRIRR